MSPKLTRYRITNREILASFGVALDRFFLFSATETLQWYQSRSISIAGTVSMLNVGVDSIFVTLSRALVILLDCMMKRPGPTLRVLLRETDRKSVV